MLFRSLHLLQLGRYLHHHGLQLLLFQLEGGQIALELLQAESDPLGFRPSDLVRR